MPLHARELFNLSESPMAGFASARRVPDNAASLESPRSCTQGQAMPETSLDEYDRYDLNEFTADELASADTSAASTFRDEPHSTTSPINATTGSTPSTVQMVDPPSLYSRFRSWRRSMSVHDLVGPVWCEVQFDYGLRQRRWQKLEKRPNSFLSADNKVIRVDAEVAAANDRTTKAGSAVHTKLERQLRPELVSVQVDSESERWALRILRMLACLHDIRVHGYCREMPCFGFLNGTLVCGVIDEVGRRELMPSSPRGTSSGLSVSLGKRPASPSSNTHVVKRIRTSRPYGTRRIDAPSDAHARLSSSSVSSSAYVLHLSDTKTRRVASLPPDEDTLSARLQLMIYHRLLTDISSSSFPWSELWERFNIDPKDPLGVEFVQQISPYVSHTENDNPGRAIAGLGSSPRTLDALVDAFCAAVNDLQVAYVDRTLEILYLHQRSVQERKSAVLSATRLQSDLEAQLVANETVQAEPSSSTQPGAKGSHTNSTVHIDAATGVYSGAPAIVGDGGGLGGEAGSVGINRSGDESSHGAIPDDSPSVIGTKAFDMDDDLLDSHLGHVFAFWMGERSPLGVSEEDTWRCRTCEYREGCEWRESKAREIEEKLNRTSAV